MSVIRFPLLCCLALLLSACHDKAAEQAKNQQLAQQTLAHLSFIAGGSYNMGDFGNYSLDKDNKILHKVTLDSFSMGQYRITWQQFNQWLTLQHRPLSKTYNLLKHNPDLPTWRAMAQDSYPASVDWQDAKDYCLWLGKVSGLKVDLPTEAQWEYAARNRGQNLLFVTNNKLAPGKLSANYNMAPVGSFPPNPLGLYDMLGNGHDWMNDWYAADYYAHSPVHNPLGPKTGTYKSTRGSSDYGGFGTQAQTITRYFGLLVTNGLPMMGFRCVVNQTSPVVWPKQQKEPVPR